jgi:hypothetical protein
MAASHTPVITALRSMTDTSSLSWGKSCTALSSLDDCLLQAFTRLSVVKRILNCVETSPHL